MLDVTWQSIKNNPPSVQGSYIVRYEDEPEDYTQRSMYFVLKKRSYSDSQWCSGTEPGYSWQGRLPDYWLKLKDK